MGEEFAQGVHGADAQTVGNHGQAAGTAEPSGPIRLNINLDNTVEGRALKAALQSETAEERRQRLAVEAERDALRMRLEQIEAQQDVVLGTIQQSDPDAYQFIVKEAALKASEKELEQLRQRVSQAEHSEAEQREAQQKYQEHFDWWGGQAANLNLNPSDPEFLTAVNQAWSNNNGTIAMNALVKLAGKQQAPAGEPEPDYVSPPSGGSPGPKRINEAEKERLYGELYELKRNPTRNKEKIVELEKRLQQ